LADILPDSERQARPLARLTPEAQREVWQDVVSNAPKDEEGKPRITAKLVAQAVEDYEGKHVKVYVGQGTKHIKQKKVGDTVRAEITRGGFANSIQ
jgi:vacuolar-type H+-ATPase subunit E/Vma4